MFVRRGLDAIVLVSLMSLFDACSCGKTPLTKKDQCVGLKGVQAGQTDSCASSDECGEHFSCSEAKDRPGTMCCLFVDRTCETEADCCPGQTCPSARKKCFDKSISCTKDADCGDKGDRFCQLDYADGYGASPRCRFRTCGALGECPDGQSCFQGECMVDLPCGGSCAVGTACVPSNDTCQDYSHPNGRDSAACPVSCNTGFIATFKDSRNIWDTCTLPDVKCVCAELPALHSNDLGRFSAIAADPANAVFVSEYDGQYGDLVVAKYGLDGKRVGLEYVDGVPSGAITYGPSGPRGGIVEPGPDVGRYTDIAVSQGRVYVSYYDVANGDLKVAIRGTDGKWANHKVDGTDADLGRYTSIAIDADGHPGVSYFQFAGESTFKASDCPAPAPTGALKYISALKFARATTATPTSAADWVVKVVACQSRTPPVCDGCTGVCATVNSVNACFAAATGCTGCDANKEACATVNGSAQCAKKFTPPDLQQVPEGVGVFSSLAFKDNDAVIAFMRRNAATANTPVEGDLVGVTINAQNAVGPLIVLDASGDTGFFPDIKVEPGSKTIAIGYQDLSAKSFKFYYAPNLQTGVTTEVIDNGIDTANPGNQSYVGADSAIVFGPPNQIWALYQDATRGDLKLAKRTSTWAVQPAVTTAGAVGFFADGVFVNGKVYASHAKINSRLVQGEPQINNSLQLDQLSP